MNCKHENPCSDRDPETCRKTDCPANDAVHRSSQAACSAFSAQAAKNLAKWGKQGLGKLGLAIAEETGELAQAILQYEDEGGDWDRIRAEAIDLGALCIQVAYYMDNPPCAACDRGDHQLGHSEHCPQNAHLMGQEEAMTKPTTQAAHSGTCPSNCSRDRIGQPQTLGDFRRMTECFSDDAPLAIRNAPLPTLYYLLCDGRGHVEIEIPDIHANAAGEAEEKRGANK